MLALRWTRLTCQTLIGIFVCFWLYFVQIVLQYVHISFTVNSEQSSERWCLREIQFISLRCKLGMKVRGVCVKVC